MCDVCGDSWRMVKNNKQNIEVLFIDSVLQDGSLSGFTFYKRGFLGFTQPCIPAAHTGVLYVAV